MTTARRKAKARSSRSSSRKIACQGFRSFDATVLSTPTIALRPATPPVGAEREPHRDGGDGQEREPALDAVDVLQHAVDLVGEDVGEPETHRDPEDGGRRVEDLELPERHAGDARGEEGRRPEPHHVARGQQNFHAVVPVRLEKARLALPAQHSPDRDRKSTRLNSSHLVISYAVFCLKKKKKQSVTERSQQAQ